MHSSLRPSCFKTKESAANLVSLSTSLWTNLESNVLDTTNEQKDPATVADAAMNQLTLLSVHVAVMDTKRMSRGGKTEVPHPCGKPKTNPEIVKQLE